MKPERIAPPCKGGACDCIGGWSRFADTLPTALAQPPAMPHLIALHLGTEALTGPSVPALVIDR